MFGWGNSEYGQFGTATEEQQICHPTHLPLPKVGRIIDIACGGTVCMVLNGELRSAIAVSMLVMVVVTLSCYTYD